MVVTGVADRAAARLRRVIYLDAFLPEDGKSLLDYLHPDRRAIINQGQIGGFVHPPPLEIFRGPGPAEVSRAQRHQMPQSCRPFSPPNHFTANGGAGLPRTVL